MAEPPHKRARLGAPDGFAKSKPKQIVVRAPAAFQSDFVQPAAATLNNKLVATHDAATRPAANLISVVKAKDTPLKAPQPLRVPDFGHKATPHTPPADFTSRARAFQLAEASGSGSLSTRPNVRTPLDPIQRRPMKGQTPHLHLESPLTPMGETPRTASPAERRVLAPPAPPRAASPTPNRVLVLPKPPETPVRKPMSKPVSAAKLLASVRKSATPAPVAPLPGPPRLATSTPPPPMQPLGVIYQPPLASPEKEQGNHVSINATRIARATDLSTAGGSADLLGVMLGASGREFRSAGEKELARGLEITPTKPKSRRGGQGKEREREKLGDRARGIFESRRMNKAFDQHVKPEKLGPPKSIWRVLEVVHPLPANSGVDKGVLSGGRENEGNAVLLRCVKEGAKMEVSETAKVLLSACVARVASGSLVRAWPPLVVVEGEDGVVLLLARYTIDETEVK